MSRINSKTPNHIIATPETKILTKFLKAFLLTGGIFEINFMPLEHVYSTFITTIAICQILGSYVGIVNVSALRNKIEILVQSCAHTFLFSIYWSLRCYKKRVLIFIENLRGDDDRNQEVINLTGIVFKKVLVKDLPLMVLFMTSMTFTSFFISVFTGFDLRNKYIYLMPFWFLCSDEGTNNFQWEFLCWKMETYYDYAAINLLQTFLLVSEVLVYFTSFLFCMCVRVHLEAHYAIIRKKIEEMSFDMEKYRRCKMMSGQLKSTKIQGLIQKQELVVIEHLRKIVKYHQFVFQITNNIMPWLNCFATAALCAVCAMSIFSAFTVITETNSENKGQFMYRFRLGSIAVNCLVIFFLFCLTSEVLIHINESIAYDLYDCVWYWQSVRYKKLLNVFLIQLQKPFQVCALGVYQVNCIFYMTVVKTIYSAVNVLLIVLTGKKI